MSLGAGLLTGICSLRPVSLGVGVGSGVSDRLQRVTDDDVGGDDVRTDNDRDRFTKGLTDKEQCEKNQTRDPSSNPKTLTGPSVVLRRPSWSWTEKTKTLPFTR